jgi:methylenetetrahydrofolate dehydrogenase (NADP+) / methenyltetrahydrofolate cyclohydrolase
MSAILLNGEVVAARIRAEVGHRAAELAAEGVHVGLGTVLVGEDVPSARYVALKHEDCAELGIYSVGEHLPATATQAELMEVIARFNADPKVSAYLVQLPLPDGLDEERALLAVDPAKDVDGLHPVNLGYLALGEPGHPRPGTPLGIKAMLAHYEVPVEGRSVVIVGRGPTLGRPLALLLSLKEPGANAAVTVVHTGVKDWEEHTRRADIVVGAAGVPNMITPDLIAPGSCVIGGGMTWEGRKALSDVDERCVEVAGWVTPRLGGVGVTTVAMLLRSTVAAAEASLAAPRARLS